MSQDEYSDEYGEEEKEYEDPKPSKEEVDYLALRQKLKESIRQQIKKDNDASFGKSQEKVKKLPYDNYGSFFGPSQPVIARRVIEESKSLLENHHSAARVSNPSKSIPTSKNTQTSPAVPTPEVPIVVNEKAQKLKKSRDYSFLLSEDAELPAPKKEPPPPLRVSNGGDGKKLVPGKQPMQSKAMNHKIASRRPIGSKGLASKMQDSKGSISKTSSVSTMDKKASLVGAKKPLREPEKNKLHSKSPQMKPPPKQMVSHSPVDVQRPKKRPSRPFEDDDEDDDPMTIFRKMTGYDPRKFGHMDKDVSNMEAGFHDIQREENRSARIAREEDKRELQLIEEEERREKMRKEAKKRKLNQQGYLLIDA